MKAAEFNRRLDACRQLLRTEAAVSEQDIGPRATALVMLGIAAQTWVNASLPLCSLNWHWVTLMATIIHHDEDEEGTEP